MRLDCIGGLYCLVQTWLLDISLLDLHLFLSLNFNRILTLTKQDLTFSAGDRRAFTSWDRTFTSSLSTDIFLLNKQVDRESVTKYVSVKAQLEGMTRKFPYFDLPRFRARVPSNKLTGYICDQK